MHHYTRVARRFTDAMSTLTDEGYLYRVDLRLRPDGKAGPLVNSEDCAAHLLRKPRTARGSSRRS